MTASSPPFVDQLLSKTDSDVSPAKHALTSHVSRSGNGAVKTASFLKALAETGEGEMARNRLIISGLILLYFVIEMLWNDQVLTRPLLVISAFFLFSLALSLHINASPAPSHRRRIIAMVGDIGTLSLGLVIGAEVTASTFPIYLWIIFGNGFRFGLFFLTISSLAATICFALVILTSNYWQSFYNLSFGLLLALVVLPLYARKLIKDLSDARRNAETASEMKSLFLASVSHELRTPLNAIIGLSDLLSSTSLDNEQREMSTSINASGRSLCGLIDNFLDYSRLEAGAMPTSKHPFCLVSLLTELNCIARAQARDKDINIGLHVTPRTPMAFTGDRGKLAQILTNLISNAVKFTKHGSVSLIVDAPPTDGKTTRLRFEVADTGIGISEASQKRIFDRFTQADARIVDQYGGTGLGLAIVQELVDLLGGQLGVTSIPGQGSTFWCEVTLAIDPDAARNTPRKDLTLAVYAGNVELKRKVAAATGYQHVDDLQDKEQLSTWLESHHNNAAGSVLIVDNSLHNSSEIRGIADRATHVNVILVADHNQPQVADAKLKATSFSQVRLNALEVELNAMINWLEQHHACRQEKGTIMTPTEGARALSILVAEDNHANQMVVRKILRHAGHGSIMTNDGEEALEALSKQDFDIILLDLNMPRMNGFEALKFMHFALHDQDIPIIALTADASINTNKKCLDAGFDACITKPYNPNMLLGTIQSLTEKSKGVSQLGPKTQKQPQGENQTRPACSKPDTQTTPRSNQPIDLERVQTLAHLGDTKFFNDLINEFDSEALDIMSKLRVATDARELEQIRLLAHALKSSAVNFGAARLVQTCDRLEYGERHDVLTAAASAVAELRSDYEEVRSALVALAISQHDPDTIESTHIAH